LSINGTEVGAELAGLMAWSGREQVSFWFEGGNEQILKDIRKWFALDELRQICEIFSNHGIRQKKKGASLNESCCV
jgi:hypothetical protein